MYITQNDNVNYNIALTSLNTYIYININFINFFWENMNIKYIYKNHHKKTKNIFSFLINNYFFNN